MKVLAYVSKEDPHPLQFNMDIKADMAARNSHKKILGKRLCDGEPLVEVMKDHPELLFGYKRLKSDIKSYERDKERAGKYAALNGFPTSWGFWCRVLTQKRRHFWFWSVNPDHGKTKMMKNLARRYACSWYNYAENFQAIYMDSQFLLMDEYTEAHLKQTTLNMICDSTWLYPIKTEDPVQKNMIVVVCGNMHPSILYPLTYRFITARFTIVEV